MAVAKKITAVEAEVKDLDLSFEFEGETYTIPSRERWPLKVFRAQENGRALGAIEALLGPAQYRKFDPDGERTMRDLEGLAEALYDVVEIDPKA